MLEARSRPHMRFNSRLLESSHNEIVMLSNLRHQRGNLTFCTENMMLNLHHLQTKSCKKITNHFSHCYLVHGVRFLKREMASIDVLLHCISSANWLLLRFLLSFIKPVVEPARGMSLVVLPFKFLSNYSNNKNETSSSTPDNPATLSKHQLPRQYLAQNLLQLHGECGRLIFRSSTVTLSPTVGLAGEGKSPLTCRCNIGLDVPRSYPNAGTTMEW